MVSVTKTSLSRTQQLLVELMQRVKFGRIEQLVVRNGKPVFDPQPIVIRKIKISRDTGPRPELHANDFALKRQLLDFFLQLQLIENGIIARIEVQEGLPCFMEVQEEPNS